MRYAAPLLALLLCGCPLPRPPKETVIKAPGGIEIHHDGNAEKAPVVTDKTTSNKVVVPAKSKIVITEEKGHTTAMGPGNKPVDVEVDRKTTVVELPADAGASIEGTKADVSVTGSAGRAPPPPPTPFANSLSAWTYAGIGITIVGIFFCTPWGGGNFRVGGLIALGGVCMGITGSLLSSITEIGLPRWFPAVGLAGVVAAIVLYWGYRLRHKQIAEETPP